VSLCGSRQGWVPLERAEAVLSTVLVGRFHQLRGFQGLGAGVTQRSDGPNGNEQISADQLPHGRALSAFFEPDRGNCSSHTKDVRMGLAWYGVDKGGSSGFQAAEFIPPDYVLFRSNRRMAGVRHRMCR
jgi:hypothetical protein